jgi:DNA-binding NarL/FixJ family response regulator
VASAPELSEGRLRVLIVDDDVAFVEALTAMLSAEPEIHVVGAAHDGIEALERTRELEPLDVILLDLEMPRMNGVETLRELRNAKTSAAVVVLTGAADHDVLGHARRQGPDGFLLKSLDPDEIVNGVLMLGYLFRRARGE